MATATNQTAIDKDVAVTSHHDHAHGHANGASSYGRYGGNPLAREQTGDSARYPAFGGEFQPGAYRPPKSRLANPAPLGLSAFALTTFILSLINMNARGVTLPNVVLASAFGYGGLVQLLAGMWEIAAGNTFGATALASYGGFWISFALLLLPSTDSLGAYAAKPADEESVLGFFLCGWWIFTTLLLVCTLRSTVAFFGLFFFLDLAFLMLFIARFRLDDAGMPNAGLTKAGGLFGLLAAFLAWYNALAGIADSSNSFVLVPVLHFPWSDKGRERRGLAKKELGSTV